MARLNRLSDQGYWNLFYQTAPTSLVAGAGNAQASLSWTAPGATYAPPTLDYIVQYSSDSGSTWTQFTDAVSTGTSTTVTGLTNGTPYVFRVAATNGLGQGAWSATSASVTPNVFRAIPVMTSATAPSGTASESGVLSPGLEAWHAFDKSVVSGDTTFYASPSPPTNSWMQYDFGSGVSSLANGYQITSRQLTPYGSTQAPTAWTVSGSNDGASFTVVDTRTSQSFGSGGEQKSYTFSSTQNWRIWRWTWTATNSSGAIVIPKLQLTA